MSLRTQSRRTVYERVRRALDVMIVLAATPLVVPLFIASVLAIQISSPGPVFFRQRRGGYRGRDFTMVKLRTMLPDGARTSAGLEPRTMTDDARMTRVTAWIRRHHLDELPQLWHVLTGEMAVIGPRPVPIGVVSEMRRAHPEYDTRMNVRPGLTGLAQIRLGYTDDPETEYRKLQYDLRYIERMSPILDLKILAATVRTLVEGTGGR